MSFEPKIFEDLSSEEPVWDDAQQLELPDDLAMFADQLRDDAAYLAQKHPADATRNGCELLYDGLPRPSNSSLAPGVDGLVRPSYIARPKNAQRGSAEPHWRRISSAAAVLLVASVGSWSAWHFSQGDAISTTNTMRDVQQPRVVTELPIAVPQLNDQPRVIPASFLREVSGPELDGMLDLLEQDESGLSI